MKSSSCFDVSSDQTMSQIVALQWVDAQCGQDRNVTKRIYHFPALVHDQILISAVPFKATFLILSISGYSQQNTFISFAFCLTWSWVRSITCVRLSVLVCSARKNQHLREKYSALRFNVNIWWGGVEDSRNFQTTKRNHVGTVTNGGKGKLHVGQLS